ncbi:Nif3-like dinuclear metal center hexameric protein [Psychrobacillus sp. NEAU-3TGS]|uniref:Nif3-like dinuclear metal center hexameric protein n=1 Tax=Psychrobacillus sp. NEAU-3TGS TaxID=2995412 RepID=UPI002497F841|nr:Nif3-like dinuclear metal center hexameric protein [Psychrobacillus sp. NEAU-3TGS]MDI2588136.1 Nif3-like dinuclear metal center hexameric protein [Psychrobacillus sp. NEAU-3TGS]
MKQPNGQQIISLFEQWAPKSLAVEGDSIGLQVGTLNKPVSKVLVTLDVNPQVVQEAVELACELIIAHHPPIYRGMKNMRTDLPQGRLVEQLIKHDIAVYAAHTNLDIATGGVNDLLADALHLKNIEIMEQTSAERLMKLAVFTPKESTEQVREALANAGAGQIGDYTNCSFTSPGEGRFKPSASADPYIGKANELAVVEEDKVEVVFPISIKNRVLKALLTSHPYEEPAYDLLLMDVEVNEKGLGRIGTLPNPVTLSEYAQTVKQQLQVPFVRVVGPLDKTIQKVAVLGGDGNKYIQTAKRAGADVFVTGDLYFHVAQDAEAIDLAVIDPGHHIESIMKTGVADYMNTACNEKKLACSFIPSKLSTEPFQLI